MNQKAIFEGFVGRTPPIRVRVGGVGLASARRRLLTAVMFATLHAAAAEAATSFTPPIRNADGDEVTCFAVNLGVPAVQVEAILRSGTGAALATLSALVGGKQAHNLATNSSPGDARYCEFNFDGNDDEVRGYIRFTDAAGGDTRLVFPASEVRAFRPGDRVTRSAPVETGAGDQIACVVQNLSNASVQVNGQVRSSTDTLLSTGTTNVAPGDVATLVSVNNPAGATHCRFAFDGNPEEVRGYVRLSNDMGGNTTFLSPASQVTSTTASVLVTPPIEHGGGAARCTAHNLGAQTVSMSVELLDPDGDVIDSAQVPLFQAGDAITPLVSNAASPSPVSCRFTIDAPSHSVRAYLAFTPTGGGTRLLQPATDTSGNAVGQADLYTPAVRSVLGNDLGCWVQNLSASTKFVTADVINAANGDVVVGASTDVGPGEVRRLVHTTQSLLSTYCRFTFYAAVLAEVRGSLTLDDSPVRILETATLAQAPVFLPTATRTGTPTATATQTSTRTPTSTRSSTATRTTTATATATIPTATATATATVPTATATIPTAAPTGSATSTATPPASATATSTATLQPTLTPTRTQTATATNVSTPTRTLTGTAQPSPTHTTASASATPTSTPTASALDATATPSTTPSATATPTPSQAPPETPTSAIASPTATLEPGAPGDANCDGTISAADLVALLLTLDNGIVDGCGEDVNEDGVVDELDIEALVSLLFGVAE